MEANDIKKICEIAREELEDFVLKHFLSSWECSCAVCSYTLHKVFGELDVDSEFCVGLFNSYGHSFIFVEDYIVDITFQQFNSKKEYLVIKEGDEYYDDFEVEFSGDKAIKDLSNWPDDQNPLKYKRAIKSFTSNILKRINNEGISRTDCFDFGRERSLFKTNDQVRETISL